MFGQHPGVAFQTGNFNAWEKLTGTKINGVGLHTLVTQNSSNDTYRFAIQDDPTAFDPNTGSQIPTIPEGFDYAIRLGNLSGNLEAERMRFLWTVTAENAILSYRYAIVTQQPNHAPEWLPTVGFLVRDLDSNVIECSEQIVLPGYTNLPLETVGGTFPVVKYNKWRTVSVDLSPYIGETLIFEAANSDCGLGPHTSYVYFTVECFDKFTQEEYCKKSNEVTLTMPGGFSNYQWSNGDSGRVINVQSPMPGDSFACTVTSFTCTTEFDVVISESDVNASFRVNFDTTLVAAKFTNESTAENSSVSHYIWSFGDGDSSFIKNPIHVYDSFGIFDIKLIVSNDFGCLDSQVIQYINFPPPYPDFSVSDSCGLTVQFANLTKPPFIGEITGYSWDFGDGFTSREISPQHTYSSGGSYQVTLLAEASNIVTDEISKSLIVYPLPNADFISEPACIGNPALFQDISTIESGSIRSWNWNIGDSLNLDSQNLNLTFLNPGKIEVILSVDSDKGCRDSTRQIVEVYPETVRAEFGYNPNPIQALETKVVFLDSSANAVSWLWTIDSLFISSDKNPAYEFLRDTGRYNVKLEVENRFGCVADTSRTLVVEPIVSLFIPSAYSPDGDGMNDEFIVKGEGIESMLITIRDRWGNEIEQVTEWNVPLSIPWIDSENSGVYSYDGIYIDKNQIRHYRKGTITVLK